VHVPPTTSAATRTADAVAKGRNHDHPAPGEPIWELADEIAEDLEGGAADFSGIVTMLHQLTALEPHDADDDGLLPVS
jgi:hypothetical protein